MRLWCLIYTVNIVYTYYVYYCIINKNLYKYMLHSITLCFFRSIILHKLPFIFIQTSHLTNEISRNSSYLIRYRDDPNQLNKIYFQISIFQYFFADKTSCRFTTSSILFCFNKVYYYVVSNLTSRTNGYFVIIM